MPVNKSIVVVALVLALAACKDDTSVSQKAGSAISAPPPISSPAWARAWIGA